MGDKFVRPQTFWLQSNVISVVRAKYSNSTNLHEHARVHHPAEYAIGDSQYIYPVARPQFKLILIMFFFYNNSVM